MAEDIDYKSMDPVTVAARLIDKGSRWAIVPQNDSVYMALIRRYREDDEVRKAVVRIADGRDLRVLDVHDTFGCILAAEEGCEWAMPLSALPGYSTASDRIKTSVAVILPFIGALFYPTEQRLTDTQFAPNERTRDEIRIELSKACEAIRLASAAGDDPFDDGAHSVQIKRGDDAAAAAWQAILEIPEKNHKTKLKTFRLDSLEDVVNKTVDAMLRWGLLRQQRDGVYPTYKFQMIMMHTLVAGFYGRARAAAANGAAS